MTGGERRARLASARLYLCTPLRPDLEAFLDAVLAAGVDIVQLRDKEAGRRELLTAAGTFRAASDHHGALFIVNDDPAMAVEADADGVHVGQDDMAPRAARAIVGDDRLVGWSTHHETELDAATEQPIDYIGAGPVEPTPTKPGRPGVGLGYVRAAAEGSLPFFVTGGMNVDAIPAARAAGASRFVVVRAISEAHDPAAAVRALRAVIDA